MTEYCLMGLIVSNAIWIAMYLHLRYEQARIRRTLDAWLDDNTEAEWGQSNIEASIFHVRQAD